MKTSSRQSPEFKRQRFRWLDQVLVNPELPGSAFKVAYYIGDNFNDVQHDGRAWVSCKVIGDAIGMSEATVITMVRRLHASGYLRIEWGRQGRGHPHNYWMVLKPQSAEVSDEIIKPQDCDVKPQPAKENHRTNQGDPRGSPLEREAAAAAAAGSGGPSSLDGRTPRRKKGRTGGRGIGGGPAGGGVAAIPRSHELALLRGKWDRGHPRDATAPECRAVEQAWAAALTSGATPEVILAAADKWIAAADAPRFLTKLPEWLETHSWDKPPPLRKQTNGSGRSGSRRRGGRQGNGLSPGDEIMAEVAEEIRQRRMAQ